VLWVTDSTVVTARCVQTPGFGLPEAADAATIKTATAAATASAGFRRANRRYPAGARLNRALSGLGVGGMKRSNSALRRLSKEGPS